MGVDAQMLVRTWQSFTSKEVRRLSVDLCEAFGHSMFMVWEDWKDYETGEVVGRHALEIVTEYTQDGDTLYPEQGETFIEVNLYSRFYGEEYERGPIHDHIAIAEWLEIRVPDARIFYGGDSSGICAEPFDANARRAIFKHFATVGHKPYAGGFGSVFSNGTRQPLCGFCDTAMRNSGGGRDRSFWYCAGCGKKVVTKIGGETLIVPRGKDFFDMRESA